MKETGMVVMAVMVGGRLPARHVANLVVAERSDEPSDGKRFENDTEWTK